MKTPRIWNRLAAAVMLMAGIQAGNAFAARDASVTQFPGFSEGMVEDLGGPQGVAHIIDKFYGFVEDDNRVNSVLFDGKPPELQEAQKKALLQTLLGKPSLADGTRHDGVQEFTETQYNALVEDLYLALESARVSYHASNRVMGKLVAYAPSLVSAFLSSKPSVSPSGEVRVGPVQPQ